MDDHLQMLLFDPQTSGGLLLAVPQKTRQYFEAEMTSAEEPFWQVGEVIEGKGSDSPKV